jgi:hypothetical protein
MKRFGNVVVLCALAALLVFVPRVTPAQQTLGAINGTVADSSGGMLQNVAIKIRNTGTNLTVNATTKNDGSFNAVDLPIGAYEVSFSRNGFKTEVHSAIEVFGGLTTTVNGALQPGEISTEVTVNATPLLNETNTTNGYTLGSTLVQEIPLGTGSFTQLAVLSPGISVDFLSGSGSNTGLGNQGIWANGQRDTSNTFTFNSVNANNLFNGNSTSNIAESRFVLNTGEIFGAGGQVQTNTSVFDAIGQALPTPPVETIQELHVSTSMYDASQGGTSGAHIELTTKSGTNQYHGQIYEYYQSNVFDAAPTFLLANSFFNGAPPLHRNVFGGTIGGPIIKDKLFFFGSYQGQRVADALSGAFSGAPTLAGLTDTNRDAADLVNLVNSDYACNTPNGISSCISVSQVDPVALALFNAKTKNGQFIIPSESIGQNIGPESGAQPFNAAIRGPSSTFNANQANANIDYNFSSKDRLAGKYYFQSNPTFAPFAVSASPGFPQSVEAGSQVFSLDNTTVISSTSTWEQRFGFIREKASATTAQGLLPSDIGLTVPNMNFFPGFNISNADAGAAFGPPVPNPNPPPAKIQPVVGAFSGNGLGIGPSTNFANAGVFQNQFEVASKYNWIRGKHTFAFGGNYNYTQLNVENRENNVAIFNFNNFADFLTGTLGQDHSGGVFLDGETNRHFRSKQVGLFAQDDIKLRSNLTVNLGLRFDWDGPLYETNGLLTNFYQKDFNYQLASDSFVPVNGTPGIGIVIAGNNKTLGTKGVSDSTLTGRQWGIAPRLGVAWSPRSNLVVRAGFGMYYDRGEFFTELSTSAGLGISGPFSVTTQQPFTIPINAGPGNPGGCTNNIQCLSTVPFGTPPGPPTNLNGVVALVPNQAGLSGCVVVTPTCTPVNTPARGFLFGGYNPANKLPYSENWTLDVQWQPRNDWVLTVGYIGNHGVHELLPIPFNQPGIATPQNPINGQIFSYGYQAAGPSCDSFNDPSPTCIPISTERVQTTLGDFNGVDGNTALRTPFIGINPNANLWTANGISNFNAFTFNATKRISNGLQFTASYTYSHALDEGSGLGAGLFFNGNNPLVPRTSYASADFDRTHVFSLSYLYQFPTIHDASRLVDAFANGWGLSGIIVAQTGQPFSIIDFSGTAGGIFYSADDFITNPILPLAPGVTPGQAKSQANINGSNGGNLVNGMPYVNPNVFSVPLLAPGQDGVPPCETIQGTQVCDNFETGFGSNGRNLFRSPFQTRFDFTIFKTFRLNERFNLKFEAQAFNIFNHPSLDAPNSNFELNRCFNPAPCYNTSPFPPNSRNFGVINGTIGSPRFLQLALHLNF